MRPLVRPYGSRCGRTMFSFAWWLALLIGFLSLSEEILWVRIAGFAYRTLPPAFSFVLMFYLLGIATGASFGKYLCGRVKNLRPSKRSSSCHPRRCDRTHSSIKERPFPNRASSRIACERSASGPVGFQNLFRKHRGLHVGAPRHGFRGPRLPDGGPMLWSGRRDVPAGVDSDGAQSRETTAHSVDSGCRGGDECDLVEHHSFRSRLARHTRDDRRESRHSLCREPA
jgi:hypothetical protein